MEIPVIFVSGKPYDLGYEHGSQTKDAIRQNFHFYLNFWNRLTNMGKGQILKHVGKFIPYIEKLDYELIEELKGVAEGSGMQFEEIVALNIRYELNYAFMSSTFTGTLPEECTAFALTPEATKDKHTFVGQNWDYKPQTKNFCIILQINQNNKPNIIMHTEAGIIGHKGGFNSEGIGICLNGIRCERDKFQPGVPVTFKIRSILNSKSLPECLRILMAFEGPNSVNMVIAHREGEAIDVECTPDNEFFIHPNSGILTHSNHFLSPKFLAKDTMKSILPDSVIRNDRVFRLFMARRGNLQFDKIKEVLMDHFGHPDSICRHRDERVQSYEQWETLSSIIINLTEAIMFYTGGTPCSNTYKSITMKD